MCIATFHYKGKDLGKKILTEIEGIDLEIVEDWNLIAKMGRNEIIEELRLIVKLKEGEKDE